MQRFQRAPHGPALLRWVLLNGSRGTLNIVLHSRVFCEMLGPGKWVTGYAGGGEPYE